VEKRTVQVPVSLLADPDQTASTKVVWMAMRLSPLRVRRSWRSKRVCLAPPSWSDWTR
jgi:hypothetical protein